MNQYETKLLEYLKNEQSKTGNDHFQLVEVFSHIGDFGGIETLEKAFAELESEGYIEKTKYLGTYHLI